MDHDPDVIVLNAGAIETEIGERGLPLAESPETLFHVNAVFPSLVSIVATEYAKKRSGDRALEIVLIGSIADGAPSSFGPVYHASKIAAHYFVSGVGPIARGYAENVRLRLYRPGAIRGPMSWAPVLRLNDRGYRIRAKRCETAPTGDEVARDVAKFIDSDRWVGTWDEPLSFRFLRLAFALAPNLYYRLQLLGWRKASRFLSGEPAPDLSKAEHEHVRELARS